MERILIMATFQGTSDELRARIPVFFDSVIGTRRDSKDFEPYIWTTDFVVPPFDYSMGMLVSIPNEKKIWNLIAALFSAVGKDPELSTTIYQISIQRKKKEE